MRQRIITGILGGALFLGLLILGGIWFYLFIALLAVIAYWEWVRMSNVYRATIPSFLGFVGICIVLSSIILPYVPFEAEFDPQPLFLVLFFLFLMWIVFSKNSFSVTDLGHLVAGIGYISLGFIFFMYSRAEFGLEFTLFILILIWCTDIGAYFSGRRFGKRPLWSAISPNKTIEGFIGGIFLALFVGGIWQINSALFEQGGRAVVMIVLVAIIAQLGDLIESAFKRHFNVKDSGTILPGHGGILDRFDSLLFVFPIVHILHVFGLFG